MKGSLKQISELAKIAAVVAGLGLVVGWLVGWQLLSDAANWFGPATALVGLLSLLVAFTPALKKRRSVSLALKVAGLSALGLAIAAALSVGAFLPGGLAEWVSPVLGKWGGGMTAFIIGLGGLAGGLSGLFRFRRRVWVNIITISWLVAAFIALETDRQKNFPSPPIAPADLKLGADAFLMLLIGGIVFVSVITTLILIADRLGWTVASAERAIVGWLWSWLGFVTAWVFLSNLLWTLLDGLAWNYLDLAWFALVGLVLVGGAIVYKRGWSARQILKAGLIRAGWLTLALAATGLVYFCVTEDLEAALLRNTAEYRVMQFWRAATGDERFANHPIGSFSGVVTDEKQQPQAGATVVLADLTGQTYTTTTALNGGYTLPDVPSGNYVPIVTGPGGVQSHRDGWSGPVVTIRPGQRTDDVNFTVTDEAFSYKGRDRSLEIGPPSSVSRDNPEPSQAIRRSFSFYNDEIKLDNGLIHEPPASMGDGPFPILLIIYPGPTDAWENVSVPLAAQGYVVVSYYPDKRLLDLRGTLSDLQALTDFVTHGEMSKRGDPGRIALVGGSVSTAFTYLMAQSLANSPQKANLKALVNYGGLIDLYRFRNSWERGQVVIDPGISQLEYLLIGFGRPDTRPELWSIFSPAYRLHPAQIPPTLLVHVKKDIIVPVEQSERADALLKRLNIPVRLLVYPELEHYLDLSKRDPAYEDMLKQTVTFLKENL